MLNKSFDGGQSGHYLPPISRQDSAINTKNGKFNLIQFGLNLIMK
jgi:hypothetical protein